MTLVSDILVVIKPEWCAFDEFAVFPLLYLCRPIRIRNKVDIIASYSVLDLICLWLDANNDDLE